MRQSKKVFVSATYDLRGPNKITFWHQPNIDDSRHMINGQWPFVIS